MITDIIDTHAIGVLKRIIFPDPPTGEIVKTLPLNTDEPQYYIYYDKNVRTTTYYIKSKKHTRIYYAHWLTLGLDVQRMLEKYRATLGNRQLANVVISARKLSNGDVEWNIGIVLGNPRAVDDAKTQKQMGGPDSRKMPVGY